MELVTRSVFRPAFPWRQLGVLALLGLLIAAALVAYVGTQRRPTPFGVAANGMVAFVNADGAIAGVDPVTGNAVVIVPGPGNDRPVYSPDGTRLAYLRQGATGANDIVVAGARGDKPVVITLKPLRTVGYFGWSPDSSKILAAAPAGQLQSFDASNPSAPQVLAVEGHQVGAKGLDDFNGNIQDIFRPPTGKQILFLGSMSAGPALFVADADGTNAQAIIDPDHAAVDYSDLDSAQWSPDGSRIALALASPDDPNEWHIYVVNPDGTNLRPLGRETRSHTDSNAAWSPDGTHVAFQRWFTDPAENFGGTRPITVVGVDDGTELEVGIVNVNGYSGWSWSPDGKAIIELAHDVAERRLQVAPLSGEAPHYLEVTPASAPSWQRIAP